LNSKRFNTNLERGLTNSAIVAGHQAHGFNTLTPAPKTSEWIKFLKTLFGGFALLLWSGALLCFFAYAIQVKAAAF
jgi:sodium/potassium-transporting ATPase subunit alpha